MATAYVVNEVGYEYNDEINSAHGDGVGTPMKVYLHKDKAESEVYELSWNQLKSCEIGTYAYDLSDIINDLDEFKQILTKYKKLGKDTSISDLSDEETEMLFHKVKDKLNETDKKRVMELITLDFYEIVEVDIDDSVLLPKPEKTKRVLSSFKKS